MSGWVENIRDHGGIKFIDLRDHYGIVQITMQQNEALLEGVNKESAVSVCGQVVKRDASTYNDKIATGTVEIDVSDCTSIGTFAIYGSAANALTKVGSMTLKWKQDGVNGGMLYPAGSFDSAAATHAVNVDTPNRVATYRYGTPYTVTVNNGTCDAVGRQYLEGDTVTVKARTIEGLAFTKWTSKDVTIADATSPTATFTMPAQDVTVTADFGAFTVQPVFTLTGE